MTPPTALTGFGEHVPAPMAKTGAALLGRPVYVAALVFTLTAALAAGFIWRQEQYRLREARGSASSLATERAHAIQTSIDRGLSATYALAAMLQQGKGTIPDFESSAGRLLKYYPGAAALELAPAGIIRQIVPLAGNEKAVGHDLLRDPARGKEAALARDTGELMLAGPFNLIQGGVAAAGRLPVFLDDSDGRETFWGFVVVLLTFPDALSSARLADLEERGYAYELFRMHADTRGKQVISASSAAPLVDPVVKTLQVPNAIWYLSIAPLKGWSDDSGLPLKSAVGLLVCLLLAWQAAWQAKLVIAAKAHERTLELRVAQRTADLERFSEITAHHLQEPARRVASYAGRLRTQLAGRVDDQEVQVSLDFISQQASRLQELLRDVQLYLAADEARGKVEACAPNPLLSVLLAKLADTIARTGAIITVAPLPAALIDAPRLSDLFRVALDNALRHGRSERTLRIEVAGERHGSFVRYHVSDNGPGVEAEYRGRVFRVFERLSSSGDGTGVGLAILRRITESAGGHAWLEETPGGGCRLVMEMPAGDDSQPVGDSR